MVQIREASPEGGFVKFDSDKGQWFEVGDRIAREKVSQTFRDALNDRYKSSTTSKTLKRRQERINRQSSTGSKDKESSHSASSSKPSIEQHEIPAAQARVDALLMAANAASGKLIPHPGISNLPPLAGAMPAFLRPTGFLPGPAGFGNYPMPNMAPSFSLMTENLVAQPAVNYGHLLLSRDIGQQAKTRRSLMDSLYKTAPPDP